MSGHICKEGSAATDDVKWIKIDGHAGIGANKHYHTLVQLAISRNSK
jgi:hypothetical protein